MCEGTKKEGDIVHDRDIVELFLKRDEKAIEETEQKYSRLCFGISKNILSDESDAEECVNDTYLALWNSIPPKEPKSLMAYAAKVARNLSLKRLEYNCAKKRCADPVPLHELEDIIADEAAIADHTEEDLGTIINGFLLTQKEDVRNVFLRRYWFFDSIESIAERYSFSESKVKSMLFHTRHKLKIYLKDKGINL